MDVEELRRLDQRPLRWGRHRPRVLLPADRPPAARRWAAIVLPLDGDLRASHELMRRELARAIDELHRYTDRPVSVTVPLVDDRGVYTCWFWT